MTVHWAQLVRSADVTKVQAKPRPVRPSKTYSPNPVHSAQSTALQRRIGPGTKTSSLKDAVVGDDFLDQSGNQGIIRRDATLQQVV